MSAPATIYVNADQPFGEHSGTIERKGWAVANAPRPIPGEVTWQGDFRHGVFYAAGDLFMYGNSWASLDAWPVVPITNQEVLSKLEAYCAENGVEFAEALAEYPYEGDIAQFAEDCGFPWREKK